MEKEQKKALALDAGAPVSLWVVAHKGNAPNLWVTYKFTRKAENSRVNAPNSGHKKTATHFGCKLSGSMWLYQLVD
ncbi:hypothetical protein [Peribacillus sp. NPDC097895]|uniref:hypothetical protein n=1 Tax=Peribacillus sp. NPDC097895 TaxID=3390619 RepID=UPI003D067470